jgi:hypothetical protein
MGLDIEITSLPLEVIPKIQSAMDSYNRLFARYWQPSLSSKIYYRIANYYLALEETRKNTPIGRLIYVGFMCAKFLYQKNKAPASTHFQMVSIENWINKTIKGNAQSNFFMGVYDDRYYSIIFHLLGINSRTQVYFLPNWTRVYDLTLNGIEYVENFTLKQYLEEIREIANEIIKTTRIGLINISW